MGYGFPLGFPFKFHQTRTRTLLIKPSGCDVSTCRLLRTTQGNFVFSFTGLCFLDFLPFLFGIFPGFYLIWLLSFLDFWHLASWSVGFFSFWLLFFFSFLLFFLVFWLLAFGFTVLWLRLSASSASPSNTPASPAFGFLDFGWWLLPNPPASL